MCQTKKKEEHYEKFMVLNFNLASLSVKSFTNINQQQQKNDYGKKINNKNSPAIYIFEIFILFYLIFYFCIYFFVYFIIYLVIDIHENIFIISFIYLFIYLFDFYLEYSNYIGK